MQSKHVNRGTKGYRQPTEATSRKDIQCFAQKKGSHMISGTGTDAFHPRVLLAPYDGYAGRVMEEMGLGRDAMSVTKPRWNELQTKLS